MYVGVLFLDACKLSDSHSGFLIGANYSHFAHAFNFRIQHAIYCLAVLGWYGC